MRAQWCELHARKLIGFITQISAFKEAILKSCSRHVQWSHDYWSKVFFIDESRYRLDVLIWSEEETYNTLCLWNILFDTNLLDSIGRDSFSNTTETGACTLVLKVFYIKFPHLFFTLDIYKIILLNFIFLKFIFSFYLCLKWL